MAQRFEHQIYLLGVSGRPGYAQRRSQCIRRFSLLKSAAELLWVRELAKTPSIMDRFRISAIIAMPRVEVRT
jgi:hypothetical protein